jgi:molecular chaperone DnaJ
MAAQREWFEKDYYAALGVPSTADEKDIKKAYKNLARQYHPDQNQGDATAEERFKEVSAAYDVLGDASKRAEYDEVRRMVASGMGPGSFGPGAGNGFGNVRFDFDDSAGGFSDLLGGLFGRGRRPRGGPQRGSDLETELFLDLDDAVRGATVGVRITADAPCSTCDGSGARPGTQPQTCVECGGRGTVAVNQGPFSFSNVCPACQGRGQIITDPCPTCRGRGVEVRPREVKVRVPAGVSDGQRIRVKGRGGAGSAGGEPGDLYVIVHVRPDETFGRQGNNLTVRVPVTFAEAALGAQVRVPTLDGPVTIKVPPGTQPGKVLRVPNRGVNGGSLLVTIDVVVPESLDDEQRAAIESLAELFPDNPREALADRRRS